MWTSNRKSWPSTRSCSSFTSKPVSRTEYKKIEECLIIKKRSSSTHSGTWMGSSRNPIRRVPPRVEGRKRLKTLGVDEVHGASPVVTIGFYSKSGWCVLLVGGWALPPLKNDGVSSSDGMMTFPTYGQIIQMFQTTKQFFYLFELKWSYSTFWLYLTIYNHHQSVMSYVSSEQEVYLTQSN